MRLFNKILAAVDNSETSDYVKSWAEGFATFMNSNVDYITVFPNIPDVYMPVVGWNKELEENLNQAKKRLFSITTEKFKKDGFNIHELEGKPDDTIIRFSEEHNYPLIIVGFKGEGKSRVPVGSTALSVARESKANVLLVNGRFKKPKKIALAEDLEHNKKSALLIAFALSKSLGAKLLRVHVVDQHFIRNAPDYLINELKFELQLELSKSVPGVDVEPVILEGDPSFELSYWAIKNDIDIVIFPGSDKRLGLVVEEFLMQTPTNVLICRGL